MPYTLLIAVLLAGLPVQRLETIQVPIQSAELCEVARGQVADALTGLLRPAAAGQRLAVSAVCLETASVPMVSTGQ